MIIQTDNSGDHITCIEMLINVRFQMTIRLRYLPWAPTEFGNASELKFDCTDQHPLAKVGTSDARRRPVASMDAR